MRRRRGSCSRAPDRADGVDVAPRHRRRAARGRADRRRVRAYAGRGVRGRRRGLYGVQFHPEVVHTPHGQEVLKNFLYERRRGGADVDARGGDRGAGRADPRAGRPRARALRALRRRRLGRRRAARAQGRRRPTHLCVRRPRAAAQGRGRAGRRDVRRRSSTCRWCTSRRRSASSRSSTASPTPSGSGRSSARSSSACSRTSRGSSATSVARAGNALLRRDRVGRHRRRRRDDQVAPQRRGPAGRHEDEARRAAAAALQGRGAAGRRGARHAGADGVAAAVPRAGPRDPHHRRCHGGAARDAARGRRDPAAGDPPAPVCTASCGSRSASFPRSGRSACRATRARTAIRSRSVPSRRRTR